MGRNEVENEGHCDRIYKDNRECSYSIYASFLALFDSSPFPEKKTNRET